MYVCNICMYTQNKAMDVEDWDKILRITKSQKTNFLSWKNVDYQVPDFQINFNIVSTKFGTIFLFSGGNFFASLKRGKKKIRKCLQRISVDNEPESIALQHKAVTMVNN